MAELALGKGKKKELFTATRRNAESTTLSKDTSTSSI